MNKMFNGRRAAQPITVAIVGGGIGGLATAFTMARAGHRVTVFELLDSFEKASRGNGVLVGPDLPRLFRSWGLSEELRSRSWVPEAFRVVKYDGSTLGYYRLKDVMDYDYGAPLMLTSRRDIYTLLYNAALSTQCVNIKYGSRVISVDPNAPSVQLASGEVLQADLVLGAEGSIHHLIKDNVRGLTEHVLNPTGQTASQTLIPVTLLNEDADLRPLLDEITIWGKQGLSVMAYRAGLDFYNVSFQYPDDGSAVHSYQARADMVKLRKEFDSFEPRVRKLLALTTQASHYAIIDHPSNPTWVHDSGKVALLGDACHPTLPPRRHGGSLAIGDAAALGNLFSRLSSISQIPFYLRAYVEIRGPPCTRIQNNTRLTSAVVMHSDEQRHRADLELEDPSLPESETKKAPAEWAFWRKEEAAWSVDAEDDSEEWWRTWGQGMEAMGIEVKMQVDAESSYTYCITIPRRTVFDGKLY